VVVAEVAAAPPEEFDGLAWKAVGEFEDFLDVLRGNGGIGALEGVLDGSGGGGGDEVTERFDVGRKVGNVLEGREIGALGKWRRRGRRTKRVPSLSSSSRAFFHGETLKRRINQHSSTVKNKILMFFLLYCIFLSFVYGIIIIINFLFSFCFILFSFEIPLKC